MYQWFADSIISASRKNNTNFTHKNFSVISHMKNIMLFEMQVRSLTQPTHFLSQWVDIVTLRKCVFLLLQFALPPSDYSGNHNMRRCENENLRFGGQKCVFVFSIHSFWVNSHIVITLFVSTSRRSHLLYGNTVQLIIDTAHYQASETTCE